jgi:nuclear mRNA export protein PCID2/THP1
MRGKNPIHNNHSNRDNNNNNAAKNFKGFSAFQESLGGQDKPQNQRGKGKVKKQNSNKTSSSSETQGQVVGLEADLDHILYADSVAKHIDPPFAELEDDFSRLKTQSIQLATLVLYLQNRLESEQPKHKRANPPETIAIAKPASQPSVNTGKIKTTTVKAPLAKTNRTPAGDPLSILYSATPTPWTPKRAPAKTPRFPNTPGTAGLAGSPMSVDMSSPLTTQLTPTLDRLLDELQDAVQSRDGERIAVDLQIEPPLAQAYRDLAQELQRHYPWGKDQHLRTLCEKVLPRGSDGIRKAWESFAGHLLQYLQFIRDYGPHNLLKNNNDIKKLLKWVRRIPIPTVAFADLFTSTSSICLGDAAYGIVILPTVLYLSKVLARLALGLDKRPDLVAQLLREHDTGGKEGVKERVTFVEDAANTIREAFIKCLSDKSGSGGFGRNAAPEGKRTGIYKTGNFCLKLLFQCRKLSSATTMFVSIDAQSPLLSHYPASQRVTYLYYLGRYHLANNHFFRAQLALQAAYDQCHSQALRHRQLTLIYLTASNICLGRFPSSKLLLRREAASLAQHFLPLCRLIASGNLYGFKEHLSLDNPHGQWFLQKRLLLQLRNRCEILVWRSLARRVFIEVGFPGGEDNKTPFLRLHLLQAAAKWLRSMDSVAGLQITSANPQPRYSPFRSNALAKSATGQENRVPESVDAEFAGIDDASAEIGFNIHSGVYTGSVAKKGEAGRSNGTDGKRSEHESHPTIGEIESIMASLIQQDLIVGFLTHTNPRFAIPGAKTRGALAVGFPVIWHVIQARKEGDQVPGWVKEDESHSRSGGFGGGGRVVNLSGARPVGAVAG